MKKIMMLTLALLVLTGCTVVEPVWETVDDDLAPAQPCFAGAYTMAFDIPADAVEAEAARPDCRVYEQREGDYAITAQTLLASGISGVVRRLTGLSADQVQLLKTQRYGLDEYQFVWYTGGDEGGQLHRATVLLDDLYGYALTFSVKEGVGTPLDQTAQQVFGSFNLFFDEGI